MDIWLWLFLGFVAGVLCVYAVKVVRIEREWRRLVRESERLEREHQRIARRGAS